MTGRFAVARPAPPAKPVPAPVDLKGTVHLTTIGTFERPVQVVAPPGDTRRIFVVEQAGRIRLLRDGALTDAPYLEITDKVLVTNESVPGLSSFGVDGLGRVCATTVPGSVYRLDPAS